MTQQLVDGAVARLYRQLAEATQDRLNVYGGDLRLVLDELARYAGSAPPPPPAEYRVVHPNAEVAYRQDRNSVKYGTLLRRASRGALVYEATALRESTAGRWIQVKLRDVRTNRSTGWEYLDFFSVVERIVDQPAASADE